MGFLVGLGYLGYIHYTHQDYMQKLDILYFILATVAIMITLHYIHFWKYIIMPYSLNFHGIFSHNTFIETRNKRTLFLDYFFDKKTIKSKSVIESIFTKDLKRFALIFNNFTSIDIDNYRQNKERILHYLGLLEENYEVSIHPIKRRSVKLIFYKLPNYYEFEFGAMIQREQIFLGIHEEGFLYRSFDTLDHHVIVGESGSGKSNFMQLLNLNFLWNKHKINKLYMVDLKGGVELKRYESVPFIEFISNIQELDKFLDSIVKELKETQEYMLLHNIRKLDKYTMLIFDEIGAVSVYPDKKLRESIFNKLALIAMQGRASGILLFLFGQKIDNTILPTNIVNNLQSRVLLKTSNDNNINLIDLKDNIRERVTAMEVQDFPKGRAIYKNGLTSDKHLMQFPFVPDKLINSLISSFSSSK
jgi:S-DNA-T family DNA segregation ATPase FtsK/SpoIIIE